MAYLCFLITTSVAQVHCTQKLDRILATDGREWLFFMMEKAGKKNTNNCGFQLWQQHNNPILLANQKIMHQKLNYLHNNPVEAGFVEKPEDWLYSSAKDYYRGTKGMIDIMMIDPMIITV